MHEAEATVVPEGHNEHNATCGDFVGFLVHGKGVRQSIRAAANLPLALPGERWLLGRRCPKGSRMSQDF
jgi:hypothetical protein